jgi:hypothetical protein
MTFSDAVLSIKYIKVSLGKKRNKREKGRGESSSII